MGRRAPLDLTPYLGSLANRWINHLAYGVDLTISLEYLERDRRRQARVERELLAEGYLVQGDPVDPLRSSGRSTSTYSLTATSRAYDAIEAVKPSLVDAYRWDLARHDWRHGTVSVPGVSWPTLDGAARKWILEHRDDYRIAVVNGLTPTDWHPGFGPSWRGASTYVADVELANRWTALRRETAIAEHMTGNIGWGLQTILDVPESIATQYWARNGATPRWHPDSTITALSLDDPGGLSAEVGAAETEILDRIGKLQAQLAELRTLRDAVARYGGWPAFMAEFRRRIEAYVDGREED